MTITSARTSRNHVAAGFANIDWAGVEYNFDLGGGKYDKATKWLKDQRKVINLVYDPYNRSKEYNKLSLALSIYAKTTTLFNVLNVIQDYSMRKKVLNFAKRDKTKHIYIQVYGGDKSGIGKKTYHGWQENRTMKEFLPEIQEVYPHAYMKTRLIIIDF